MTTFYSCFSSRPFHISLLASGLFLFGGAGEAQAQVGIGTTTPDASAVLELSTTTKGLLLPRLTKVQRDAIQNPAAGLIIYQTDNTAGLYLFGGSSWSLLPNAAQTSGDNLGNHTATQHIFLNDFTMLLRYDDDFNHGLGYSAAWGGAVVDGPVLYGYGGGVLGSTINGTRTHVLSWRGTGRVGIGTAAPTATLHVSGNNSTVRLQGLSGTGTRMVTADATGILSTDALPLDTDAQQLSLDGSTLSLTDGGSVTLPTGADNLGNHTATQNLDLGTFSLVGNGGTSGLGISSSGRLEPAGTNVLLGQNAGNDLLTGSSLTAVGSGAGASLTTGSQNTLLGTHTGAALTDGTGGNLLAGHNAGNATTSGLLNVALGYNAFKTNLTGSSNTIIGAHADVSSAALTNATALGYQAKVSQSNSLVLGGTGSSAVSVGIGTTTPAATLHVAGSGSTVRLEGLAGAGTRYVTVDNSGSLSTTASGGEATTASNGLTLSGTDVKLGVLLNAATTVDQGNNFLAFTNGQLGIGYPSSPSNSRLTVAANSATENGMQVRLSGNTSTANSLRLEQFGSNFIVRPLTAGGSTSIVENSAGALSLNPNGGSVGIGLGTGSPAGRLHVAGTSGTSNVRLESLGDGSTTRVVTADAEGDLSTVTTASLTDNLGNHTATQALSLQGYGLTGTGSSISGVGVGVRADGA